ncbi:MAG: hypothetical protein H0U98_02445 [Alphaproteobacteria bacterium]|nr:hypothetical protein [Alphaproteobacteria bacterium]
MMKRLLKSALAHVSGAAGVLWAIGAFRRNKRIAKDDWFAILNAHCATNGAFTDRLTPVLHRINPQRPPADATGLLGHFSIADQKQIAGRIARDGFHIFDAKLPGNICDAIERFARRVPAAMYGDLGLVGEPTVYDPARPHARLYKFSEEDSLAEAGVQALIADDALLRIAETYLDTQAVIGGIDTWWSAPHGNGPSSEAAQLFHFDFDAPPRWLKLFVYVTPVGPENGPHVYVKASHKAGLPGAREIVSRGYERIADQEIEQAFGADAATEIIGARGTVFLADTRGFHKGKFPTGGDRLICQLLYCSPVFCDRPRGIKSASGFSPGLLAAIAGNPAAFSRYSA